MPAVRVRLASAADETSVATIIAEYCEALEIVVRDSPAELRSYLAPPSGVWLATCGEAVAGCIALRPLTAAVGEIKRLYVRPAYRGRGIADALLDALEAAAHERGFHDLYLDTHDGLKPATRFYERRGYVHRARYNDNPQATIFMERRLA